MKILIATGIYTPQIGGPATHTKLLEHELPGHGVKVDVVAFSNVIHLPKGISHLVYFFQVLAKSFKVDIVYALDPVSVGLPAYIASLISRRRFIVRIVGDYAWEQGTARFGVTESLDIFSKEHSKYPFSVQILKRVQTFVASKAWKIIVPSKYLKNIVFNWGISEKSIVVIYNSFNLPENLAEKKVLRELMRLKGTIMVSAGRLVKWKGYELLISIMPELTKSVPDLRLFIIGSGSEEENLHKAIKKANVEDTVTLIGQLDHDTLLRYLKAADLFVLNTFYEGFSHIILEAMALGVPTVTTRVGGNPEIIEHKKDGLLYEYNNEKDLIKNILLLLKDETFSRQLSKLGEKKAGKFSKKRMITELLKEIKK